MSIHINENIEIYVKEKDNTLTFFRLDDCFEVELEEDGSICTMYIDDKTLKELIEGLNKFLLKTL